MTTDKFHSGTIQRWVEEMAGKQLRDYVKSDEVKQQVSEGFELRAHLVIVVGSRHILLWDMDGEGNLSKPRLAGENQ